MTVERTLTCPRCGQIGSVRLEQTRTPSGMKLFIVGIDGRFIRSEKTNSHGQPIVHCDVCATEIPVERRKGDDVSRRTAPPGAASVDADRWRDS